MKNAIKKAIEGGYLEEEITSISEQNGKWYFTISIQTRLLSRTPEEILLDPKFWQALGKAEGWARYTEYGGRKERKIYEDECVKNGWIIWEMQMHYFIDHLIEEKPIDEFFEKLLNKKLK